MNLCKLKEKEIQPNFKADKNLELLQQDKIKDYRIKMNKIV